MTVDRDAINALLAQIEAAVDAHPGLDRRDREAAITVDRHGVTARIVARTPRTRRMARLWAQGVTPEDAVATLIRDLNYWAESLKP